MKLCLITSATVSDAWANNLKEMSGNDVIVFGSNGLGLVSYKKELGGETEYFSDVARLSKELRSVVISGCDTDTYGVYRHSAVVADRGKIVGVTDAVYSVGDSEFVAGGDFKVYDTSAGRIGVIVEKDLFFPDSAKILSLCAADILICVYKKVDGHMPAVMLRANAFSSGLTSVLVGENYSAVSDAGGNIVSAGGMGINAVRTATTKDYSFITVRRRGLFKDAVTRY